MALLENHGIKPTIIEYLKIPIAKDKLIEILSLLRMTPRDLMRKKEAVYAEKGLDNLSLSDAELIDIMVKNPILIERPIVLANRKAALGRPPEQVLNIL